MAYRLIEVAITQPNSNFSLNHKLIALKEHYALLSDTVTSREFVHTNSISASKIAEKENRVFLTVKVRYLHSIWQGRKDSLAFSVLQKIMVATSF